MTIAQNELQVQWSAANSVSVSSGSAQVSDAVSASASAISAMIALKADNDGTPANGDTVDFYILYTLGDPDGASTDEYDTNGHGTWLARLDTNVEDPAILSVPIPAGWKGAKIRAVNNSGGRSITVSATIREITG